MAQKKNAGQIDIFPEAEGPGEEGNQYEKDQVVSAWIKEMRLGNVEDALYWTEVILEELKLGHKYLMRRLAIFAFEDAMDSDFVQYVAAGLACCPVTRSRYAPEGDANIGYALVEAACRASKFWETQEGRDRERAWAKVERDLQNGVRKGIPTYGRDMHTQAGRALKGEADNRFSGDDRGRENMCVRYERFGDLRVELEGMFTWGDVETEGGDNQSG